MKNKNTRKQSGKASVLVHSGPREDPTSGFSWDRTVPVYTYYPGLIFQSIPFYSQKCSGLEAK